MHTLLNMLKITVYLAFVFAVFVKADKCYAQRPTNTQDSLALVDLYNSTGGKNWKNNAGWLNGPVYTWFGVTADTIAGRVIAVNLSNNNLEGRIVSSIGNLTALSQLILTNNKLSEELPSTIGKLVNLENMSLGSNQISGPLPPTIGNLVKLRVLDFNFNRLSDALPSTIGQLKSLELMNLYGNLLTSSLPFEFGNLENLKWVDLQVNQISGELPTSIGNLSELRTLHLTVNKFSGKIPAEIGQLRKLESLVLSSNQFDGEIPNSIGNLTNLKRLHITATKLSGEIPPEIGNLKSLESLDVSFNKLTKLPQEIGNLANLQSLFLHNNRIAGPVPESLVKLSNLKELTLNNNKFTFSGLEETVKQFGFAKYEPQDSLLRIRKTAELYSVTAGGTLENNTYKWFKDDKLEATINGDSTFASTGPGRYHVEVTNAIATKLTLKSNATSLILAIDPNPSMIAADGTISKNVALIDATKFVEAAATDGITKLLLVTDSDEPITFSVFGNNNGSLCRLENQGVQENSIIVTPNDLGKVVAIYTVPDGYGVNNPKDGRTIIINSVGVNSGSSADIKLKLVTPPVVMVHGMWSDPFGAWVKTNFYKKLQDAGFYPSLVDYKPYNAMTFNPLSLASLPARSQVIRTIYDALGNYRNLKVAVSQVDVVGHSLGGLLIRSLAQQDGGFYLPENFNKGFVHKLITLATPHKGSPLGPVIWNARNRPAVMENGEIKTLEYLMNKIGLPIGSVHPDFDEQSSAIRALQSYKGKAFSITGTYRGNGPVLTDSGGYYRMRFILPATGKQFSEIFKSPCGNYERNSDLVVPYFSQFGGISQTRLFYGTGHSDPPSNFTETNSAGIQNYVVDLLLSDERTRFAENLPPPSSILNECSTPNNRVLGKSMPLNEKKQNKK